MPMKLSFNPIAWSNDDLPQLSGYTSAAQCLKDINESGLTNPNSEGKLFNDKNKLSNLICQYETSLSSGLFAGNLLNNNLEAEIEILGAEIDKRLHPEGNIIVYCEYSNTIQSNINTPLSRKPFLDDKQMKSYGYKYSRLSEYARRRKVTLAYHFHMGTIIQTVDDLDRFIDACDDKVRITFDTGHMYFAGGDPLTELTKHINRVVLVHLKDVRDNIKNKSLSNDSSFLKAILDGIYTVPGDGNINFLPIIDLLQQSNYKGWVLVEAREDISTTSQSEHKKQAQDYLADLFDKYNFEVEVNV